MAAKKKAAKKNEPEFEGKTDGYVSRYRERYPNHGKTLSQEPK